MSESVDLRVAQGALQRAYEFARASIELHTACVVDEAWLHDRLDRREPAHKTAGELYKAASAAHRAGDLEASADGYKKSRNNLELVLATQQLVHEVDIEV